MAFTGNLNMRYIEEDSEWLLYVSDAMDSASRDSGIVHITDELAKEISKRMRMLLNTNNDIKETMQ